VKKTFRAATFSAFALTAMAIHTPAFADGIVGETDDSLSLLQTSTQTEAQRVTDGIYKATGFGNSFLVVTDKGNVIIDTSLDLYAPGHKKLLNAVNTDEPKYIIITHGHGDHTGGIPIWRGKNTEVIAQKESVEFLHYQKRLSGFFGRQNAAQFNISDRNVNGENPGNYDATIPATILFDKKYSLDMGNMTFDIRSAPAETYDALTVWISERKAVFVGDLLYTSFPNIYTLRGTKPRWALDYVNALNEVLKLDAEILLGSHGEPIIGAEEIKKVLTLHRDAILYVHDATVAGMNEGKDVHTLIEEIELPEELYIKQPYGTVAWSVRGIYDGYIGWFDGNPTTMLGIKPAQANSDLIEMAGGADMVSKRAQLLAEKGNADQALALTDSILSIDPRHKGALTVRLAILTKMHEESGNYNEKGWLGHGIREAEKALAGQ